MVKYLGKILPIQMNQLYLKQTKEKGSELWKHFQQEMKELDMTNV